MADRVKTLAGEKWVRIMCDYSADGIWAKDGGGECLEELPVSEALRERIRAWQIWHDRDNADYVPPDHPEYKRLPPAFSSEGLAIAQAVKAELPDWTVVYFDEIKCRYDRNGQPRHEFEYEIESDG